jgi:probable blue pigment (indigoidine) exporter
MTMPVALVPAASPAGAPSLQPPRARRMLWITAAWGSCFLFIAWGLRDAPALWFAALRALTAGAVLVAVGFLQRQQQPRGVRAWGWLTLIGLVNVTIAFAAMFAGVAGLATGTAAVLANAQPLLILLPAWWLYGERLSWRTALALVVGFAGLLLVALPGGGGSGAALSLVAAAAVTAGTLLSRRLAGLDVVAATGWHLLIGGLALAGVALLVEGAPVIAWTPRFVLSLVFLSLVGTAATTVAWFVEARRSRLDALTAWTFLTPVVGLVLAVWVLGERPAGWSAVGLAASVVAMWVALRSPRATRAGAGEGEDDGSGSGGRRS